MRGEWIKLLSLRSTWWTLGSSVAVMTLIAFASAQSLDGMADDLATAGGLAQIHGATIVSGGSQIGVVAIAVLGALLITGEYSTGMIRSTLAAVPTRVPVLVAKAIALVALTSGVTAVSLVLSYVVTKPQLSPYDLVPAFDDVQTWQVFGGTVYFLVAAALFALGVGAIVLLLLPGILGFISLDWVQSFVSYLPLPAAGAFLTLGDTASLGGNQLTPGTGLLVIAAYAIIPLVIGALVLHRRDA
jgi:ABC-2 type transport system permease protein